MTELTGQALADAIRALESEKASLLAQLYRTRHAVPVSEAALLLKQYVINKHAKEPLQFKFRDASGAQNLWKGVGKSPAETAAEAAAAADAGRAKRRCAVV